MPHIHDLVKNVQLVTGAGPLFDCLDFAKFTLGNPLVLLPGALVRLDTLLPWGVPRALATGKGRASIAFRELKL